MKKREMQPEYFEEFTPRQERANILIHVLGIIFGIVAIPFLITMAKDHNTSHIISISVYAFCFLMLFACSTLYHAVRRNKLRMLFKKLDRISIYFLIAGTYTPIIRFYLFDGTGIALLVILWALVLAGIFFEVFFPGKFNVFSVIAYLIMGLVFVFVPHHFFSSMPMGVMLLVLIGVGMYCFGVIFYLWQKWPYHHAIWHFFVLGGSVCHFAALLQTVA